MHRQDTDMGYDVIAFQNEAWNDLEASWNAKDQDCHFLFGIIWQCTVDENVDWLPDNGVDDQVLVNLGTQVYATLDDIGDHYGDKVTGVGEIKQWDVTDLVKAWVGGTENPEYGLAIRNSLDATCPQCPQDSEGNPRRYLETPFWSKDATYSPIFDKEWPRA